MGKCIKRRPWVWREWLDSKCCWCTVCGGMMTRTNIEYPKNEFRRSSLSGTRLTICRKCEPVKFI